MLIDSSALFSSCYSEFCLVCSFLVLTCGSVHTQQSSWPWSVPPSHIPPEPVKWWNINYAGANYKTKTLLCTYKISCLTARHQYRPFNYAKFYFHQIWTTYVCTSLYYSVFEQVQLPSKLCYWSYSPCIVMLWLLWSYNDRNKAIMAWYSQADSNPEHIHVNYIKVTRYCSSMELSIPAR